MKKLIIVFAFALFATFTYAAYTVTKTNNIVDEKFDDDPKKKSKEKKSEDKKKCTKSEKKSCAKTCTKSEKKSCSGKK